MKWPALILCLGTVAAAAPTRVLLSIGHDVGGPGDATLSWAEADARRVRDVFVELGGVSEADAELVVGQPVSNVEAALARLEARVRARRAAGDDATAIVYVSSHARQGTLRLGGTELPLQRLRERLDALPAGLTLLVVDACSSGAAARLKGGRLTALPRTLQVEPARGTVVITSSGPAEPAQEWDSLKGSLFSHYWLAALRGDADLNRDGAITLLEAYGHAWRQTLARADQHPSFDFDLRGSGELVLTEPFRSPSALSFPEGLGGRFVVAEESEARLVLELDRDGRVPLRLAVPPGTYRVRRSSPEGSGQTTVELARGTVRTVSSADFVAGDATRVALKGGARNWSLGLGISARGGGNEPLVGGVGLLRYDFGPLWVAVQPGLGSSPGTLEAAAGLLFGTSVETGPLRLSLGLVARPRIVWRDAEEGVRRAAAGFEGGGQVGVELTLAGTLFVGGQAEAVLRVAELDLAWRLGALTGVRF
jgi:hypothetical protein